MRPALLVLLMSVAACSDRAATTERAAQVGNEHERLVRVGTEMLQGRDDPACVACVDQDESDLRFAAKRGVYALQLTWREGATSDLPVPINRVALAREVKVGADTSWLVVGQDTLSERSYIVEVIAQGGSLGKPPGFRVERLAIETGLRVNDMRVVDGFVYIWDDSRKRVVVAEKQALADCLAGREAWSAHTEPNRELKQFDGRYRNGVKHSLRLRKGTGQSIIIALNDTAGKASVTVPLQVAHTGNVVSPKRR